jgi:hypothetical protein
MNRPSCSIAGEQHAQKAAGLVVGGADDAYEFVARHQLVAQRRGLPIRIPDEGEHRVVLLHGDDASTATVLEAQLQGRYEDRPPWPE